MGDDSVVACFGTKVANYWNIDFASIPIEVSELIHSPGDPSPQQAGKTAISVCCADRGLTGLYNGAPVDTRAVATGGQGCF